MYLIKDLIEQTGLSRESLNFYYRKKLFKSTRKNSAGYRIFNNSTLKRLNSIIKLRQEGKALKEIKEILS